MTVSLVASGSVEDYDEDAKQSIATKFAELANVTLDAVTVEVASAGVQIHVTIDAADESTATSIEATVSPALANTSAATSTLGITVEVAPLVQRIVTVVQLAAPPYSPPSPPAARKTGNNDGVIIGASIGGAVGLILIIVVGYLIAKSMTGSAPKSVEVKPTDVQVAVSQQSTSNLQVTRHSIDGDKKMEPVVMSAAATQLATQTSASCAIPRMSEAPRTSEAPRMSKTAVVHTDDLGSPPDDLLHRSPPISHQIGSMGGKSLGEIVVGYAHQHASGVDHV